MNYGLPYMGSKNTIAKELVTNLPRGSTLYDLFAGGCAITHAALLSKKYHKVIANDLNPLIPKLFYDAINGKYKNETRWISREQFFDLRLTDGYVQSCWSFGNNGKDYLYGKNIEGYKKALHYAIVFRDYEPAKEYGFDFSPIDVFDTINERRLGVPKVFKRMYLEGKHGIRKKGSHYIMVFGENSERLPSLQSLLSLQVLQKLESLQRLQKLERLESLQSLEAKERLQKLETLDISNCDYRDVKIESGGVIYCDIPYKGKGKYVIDGFDYDAFYDWAKMQTEPVFVSSYDMPNDWISVWNKKKMCSMSLIAPKVVTENLFVLKKQRHDITDILPTFQYNLFAV